MPEGQTGATCENLWKKRIGKPYSGKPNVRFDEGELEIEPSATTPALHSTETRYTLSEGCFLLKTCFIEVGSVYDKREKSFRW
ncbi:MAG TPA: hypothetical protein VLZ10_08855 [Thermodesulfobacteriota bacterium]|nr:hypothetical protein [Thermodesulfobacteriota bacterium]